MSEAPGPNPPRLPTERPGPKGGKRDRNRRERTAALMSAALELFLERGVEQVTIDAIAREAGVAKGSFYRYFADKGELVAALVQPVRERLEAAFSACREALAGDPTPLTVFATYASLGGELNALVGDHEGVARLYLQETRGPAGGARAPLAAMARLIADSAIELTEHAQRHGLIREVTPAVSALTVVGAAERLLQASFDGELTGDPAEVTTELIGIVLGGLTPDS